MGRPVAEPGRSRLPRERLGRDVFVPRLRAAEGQVQAPMGGRDHSNRRDRARRDCGRNRVRQGDPKDLRAGLAPLLRRAVRRERDRAGASPLALRRRLYARAPWTRPEAGAVLGCDLRYGDEGLHRHVGASRDDRYQGVRRGRSHLASAVLQRDLYLLRQPRDDADPDPVDRGERQAVGEHRDELPHCSSFGDV